MKLANTHYSACPLNCWDSCGFKVTVSNGKIEKITGDPDHPITQGKICGRGRMLELRANSTERLLYPLKKMGHEFKRIPWEQALDEISVKIAGVKQEYGSASILHSHDYANNGLLKNLDERFFNCLGGVTHLVGSLCWGAGIEAQKWDFGDAYSHEPNDVLNSRNIVVWGRNASRTNMHFYQMLQKAKMNGAKLFVIDPLFNGTAKIADEHVTVKPGFDGLLAAGIMKELLRLQLEDRAFIDNHTHGFEDLAALLETISLEEISRMSEVPVSFITNLARIYGDGPTSTFMGLGMQRYENGGNTIRLLDALVAISGNIGIQGGGANYANRQVGQSFATGPLTKGDTLGPRRYFPIMEQAEQILSADDPPIKMIIVTCGNPLTQLPDTTVVERAFSSVDTLVVMDQYMTDTAQLADYVLPVATVFEEEDVYFSSMYHHYANYGPKLVEAPGEVKPDLWIWTQLADRLGFGCEFSRTREEWLELALKPLKKHGITLEKLRSDRFVELPVEKIPWSGGRFQTPSGKYEFTSTLAAQKGVDGRLTLAVPKESKWSSGELAAKYPYTLLTIHPARSNHSQHFHLFSFPPAVKVEIAENIANQLNLQENDRVRVWNGRGEVYGNVIVLRQAHPNTINMDEGIWKKFGGPVNKLTSSRPSDNGLGSTLYDCLVNIEKVDMRD